MDVDAIQTFVRAVEMGSFAAVARAKGVAPSSVSRQIAELESAVGVRLFHRSTRRLSLSDAGQAYFERVGPLLEALGTAGEVARDLGMSPRGRLRVAVASSFATEHLSGWLPSFLAKYPELEVELLLDARYTDLVAERIDVAVRLGQVEPSSVVVRRLCTMPRAIVASPTVVGGRVLAPEDLAREPGLLFPYDGFAPRWKLRDAEGRLVEVAPRARVVASDGQVLRRLALAGEGFALLPRWLCAEALAAGALVDAFPRHQVTATELDAWVTLVYPSRAYVPLKVRAFVDHVVELFRAGPPWERAQGGARRKVARPEGIRGDS